MKNFILVALTAFLVCGATLVGAPSRAEAEAGYHVCQRYDEEDRETYYMKRDSHIPIMGGISHTARTCEESPFGDWENMPSGDTGDDNNECENFTYNLIKSVEGLDVCYLMDDLHISNNAQYTKNDLLADLGRDLPRTGGESDSTTVVCRYDRDGIYSINNSKYILVNFEAYKRIGCESFEQSLQGANFEFAASCGSEDDFYVELCKAKKTWVITTTDLDKAEKREDVKQLDYALGQFVVTGAPNYFEVLGYNYPI